MTKDDTYYDMNTVGAAVALSDLIGEATDSECESDFSNDSFNELLAWGMELVGYKNIEIKKLNRSIVHQLSEAGICGPGPYESEGYCVEIPKEFFERLGFEPE